MCRGKLQFVKTVTAKGRRYEYFDTGLKTAAGKPVLKRLPAREDVAFGSVYAALVAGRTKRAAVAAQLTLPALVDLYDRSPEFRALAASTQATYRIYLTKLAAAFDTAPADGLERRDVMLLRDRMADRPGAANGLIRATRALYAWARQREHVAADPCKGIELFQSEDYEPWPEPLLADALASDDLAIRLPAALLYYTAQRVGDVCALRWSDVREGVVHVTQQKTGKPLEIRLHSDLAALLAGAPRKGLTILAERHGRPGRPDTIRDRLQRWAAERGHKVVPHGLRKNAVNALLEAGCSVAETSAVTGQSLKIVEHYAKRRNGRALASAAILKMEAKR